MRRCDRSGSARTVWTGFGDADRARLRRRQEAEGNAQDLGVLGLEHAVRRRVVARAAERPADHLLAQELGPEGADAQDVGDGVGVPALGQHRDRDDAADVGAQAAGLADGVQDLAQDVLVLEVVDAAAREAGDVLALELLDLAGGGLLERGVEGVAAVELHRSRSRRLTGRWRQRPPSTLLNSGELAGRGDACAPPASVAVVAGDPVVDELADAWCSSRRR